MQRKMVENMSQKRKRRKGNSEETIGTWENKSKKLGNEKE